MNKFYFLFFSALVFFVHQSVFAQHSYSVYGVVKDSATWELLPGTTLSVKNNSVGTVADKNGKFKFTFTDRDENVILLVNYVGYKPREIKIKEGNHQLNLLLQKDLINQPEVLITESRIPQSVLESPVTMIKIDSKKIEQFPNENFFAGLATQKGVDVITNSLFYKVLNLRGFAFDQGEGMLSLVDGLNNMPPGLDISMGNLAGPNDIDVDNIEIIPGSASAIYGANAFNGLVSITTKDPFRYQGLTVLVKSGCNYIDNTVHAPALFSDYQVRFAKAFKERFAFKINFGYQAGTDWLKLSQTDFDGNATDATRGVNNPGRDIANIKGDDVHQGLPIGPGGTLVNVSRTGWNANTLSGTDTHDMKASASVHYRVRKKTELSYLFSYSLFSSNLGAEDWNLKNFRLTYHKIELKNDNYFVRVYNVTDDFGKSTDIAYVASSMNAKWKSDDGWFNDYTNAYNGSVSGVTAGSHQLARNYADIGMPQPGDESFNRLLDEFKNIPVGQGGGRYIDKSSLNKFLAQYDFSKKILWAEIIVGLDFGWRKLYSEGTQFWDYPPPSPIYDNNYSGYMQVKKKLAHNRLSILASLRMDKFSQNFLNTTPRLAFVYEPWKNNFLRASFQTGTLTADPFVSYAYAPGDYGGVGGAPLVRDRFHLNERSFDANSVMNFLDAADAYLLQYGQDSIRAAASLYKHLLKPSGIDYLGPEKVRTFEFGYQSLLMRNKIHVDIDFFFSIYEKMIGFAEVEMPSTGNPNTPDSINAAALSFLNSDYTHTYTGANAKKNVYSGGAEAGIEYNLYKNYVITANFTFQKENLNDDLDIGVFWAHSPPFKTNVSLSNADAWRNFGFSFNWRWADAIEKNGNNNNPHIHNELAAHNVLDAQVSYSVPKLKAMFRIGASNLLNHYYLEYANAASIGGVYYVSILYNAR